MPSVIESADALALARFSAVLGPDADEAPTGENAFVEAAGWDGPTSGPPGFPRQPRQCQELATAGYFGGCPVDPL